MAENSHTQNQQFLRKLESQRLSRVCHLAIDLRGKVAGECQAYEFGGLTHHLDDRAYLLAKQLLERFNGHYTIGVNEALLKTIKSLNDQVTNDSISKPKSQQSSIQTIIFDRLLQRKEPRIIFATPVEIRLADVLYHASTIDITSSAIHISLKRAFTLEAGDMITANFPDFKDKYQPKLLDKVNYKILKIEHNERRTHAILVRDRDDNINVTTWFDDWSQRHNSPENVDLDGELFNLASHYYLRLFCSTTSNPLFWLTSLPNEEPVRAFSLSPAGQTTLAALQDNNENVDFSLLPIRHLIKEKRDCLIFIYQNNNKPDSLVIPRDDKLLVTQALAWHSQQQNSHVLLMQVHSLLSDLSDNDVEHLIELPNDAIEEYTQNSSDRLSSITTLASLCDITNACQQPTLQDSNDNNLLLDLSDTTAWSGTVPTPNPLRHYINRKKQRFFVKTEASITFDDQTLSITTHNVSEDGLSFHLPGHIDIPIGTKVHINFIRWQNQAKKTKIDAVPFTIRNRQFWQQSTHFGLERIISACPESVNKFFATNMECNKEQLRADNDDLQITQETKILAPLLVQQFTSIPFYLGRDNDNKRVIQAIASSQSNNGRSYLDLIYALSTSMAVSLSELVIALAEQHKNTIGFGLYCYLDNTQKWQFSTEHNFTSQTQKALCINRALTHDHYHFFHCTLTPIKSSLIEQEIDLNDQLAQLRPHIPHKTTQLRKTLHQLFAIGELTDITDILKASY